MKILAISGSLRATSSNAALLRAAAATAGKGTAFDFYDEQMAALPPFNPDVDGEGAIAPPAVAELRGLLRAADAVMIATPEYAHGPPGVLKNALDWIVSSGELENKPVALLAASPGGGRLAQAALTPTLEVLGARLVVNIAFVFSRKLVDASGRVSDPDLVRKVKASTEALVAAVAS